MNTTYCPNMPLRGLLYLVDLYKKHIKDIDLSVKKQIMIPTPHYIVFIMGQSAKKKNFIRNFLIPLQKAMKAVWNSQYVLSILTTVITRILWTNVKL